MNILIVVIIYYFVLLLKKSMNLQTHMLALFVCFIYLKLYSQDIKNFEAIDKIFPFISVLAMNIIIYEIFTKSLSWIEKDSIRFIAYYVFISIVLTCLLYYFYQISISYILMILVLCTATALPILKFYLNDLHVNEEIHDNMMKIAILTDIICFFLIALIDSKEILLNILTYLFIIPCVYYMHKNKIKIKIPSHYLFITMFMMTILFKYIGANYIILLLIVYSKIEKIHIYPLENILNKIFQIFILPMIFIFMLIKINSIDVYIQYTTQSIFLFFILPFIFKPIIQWFSVLKNKRDNVYKKIFMLMAFNTKGLTELIFLVFFLEKSMISIQEYTLLMMMTVLGTIHLMIWKLKFLRNQIQ